MLKRRWMWLLALALGAMILFTLLAAPGNGKLNSGSTYSQSPDGYGAWYAFMEKQGTPVKRWQKPFDDLPKNQRPITLLRVNSQIEEPGLYGKEQDWVKGGNTLVILGVRQPVTPSAFSTQQSSNEGEVKIDTRRRKKELPESEKSRLGDRFGAVVWEQKLGKGRVIYATTPHLAANAYQDELGNYKFLAQLVTQSAAGERGRRVVGAGLADSRLGKQVTLQQNPPSSEENPQSKIQPTIWVDEYVHGYKDSEVRKKEGAGDWVEYLANTPLASAFVQTCVILLVLVVAGTRRFGPPVTRAAPVVDNSEAYIQALAGVLHKADSSEFVLEVLGKEEQLQLAKALGLGIAPVDHQALINAWVQQTGRAAAELEQVLQVQSQKRRISEKELLSWLGKWQTLRRHLRS